MQAESVIVVNSLSKTYRLYQSHRDRMKEFFHPLRKKYHTWHHALNNVSFTVEKGEVLGVVGHNGSGKSTLLKILASVVSPTSGFYKCNGRVTALLELGGGFNEEMTGVENIFFIGALQGFRKKDMKERVRAILDFADIGEYAWQPVKSYSSGMYVRLAFSMNININPDILIIDEALSVGDMRFQQKCYRKIKEIKESGKTIVFCSHSLSAVKDFCTRAIWINKGEIVADGNPVTVTDSYQAFMVQTNTTREKAGTVAKNGFSSILSLPLFAGLNWIDLDNFQWKGDGQVQIYHATIVDADTRQSITKASGGQKVFVLCLVMAHENVVQPGFQLTMNGHFSTELFKINTHHYGQTITLKKDEPNIIVTEFIFPNLANGNYTISLAITQLNKGHIEFIYTQEDGLIVSVDIPKPVYNMGTQIVIPDARVFNLEPGSVLTH